MDIRPWRATDIPQLIPLLVDALAAGAARGEAIIADEHNATFYAQLGVAQAEGGHPTLCAVDGEDILGFVMWSWCELPLHVAWKVCFAGNSYVRPDARHRGVANALRQAAGLRCRAAGVERIIGPVHLVNTRGIQEFVRQGAWPTSVQMEVLV